MGRRAAITRSRGSTDIRSPHACLTRKPDEDHDKRPAIARVPTITREQTLRAAIAWSEELLSEARLASRSINHPHQRLAGAAPLRAPWCLRRGVQPRGRRSGGRASWRRRARGPHRPHRAGSRRPVQPQPRRTSRLAIGEAAGYPLMKPWRSPRLWRHRTSPEGVVARRAPVGSRARRVCHPATIALGVWSLQPSRVRLALGSHVRRRGRR
jgi:hypothetical protein